jgi:hypothetical protein
LKPGELWWSFDNRLFSDFVLAESADSWGGFLGWLNELQGAWGFRGQHKAEWLLETSLDRAVPVRWSPPGGGPNLTTLNHSEEERDLLFKFKQQAHHYLRHLPNSDEGWIAAMQHHGVPTRFQDWTESPYVALYFALEKESSEKGCSAVWAIDLNWLKEKEDELLQSEATSSDAEVLAIVRINPARAPERMIAQQGFFLCSPHKQGIFSRVLMYMMTQPKTPSHPVVRKLNVERSNRITFLKKLREMNIHRASLFPGLDGFGQSLKHELEIKVADAAHTAIVADQAEPSFADLQKMIEDSAK